ncbi:MAG: reverse transcriptase domain-containing protein, partial [Escherichia coli]|nr:reverse transcriptase domain-containing protein [Escherichia coli]
MMYGEEKSDSLIVAAKQANNPKGAESVERRSGAKGNAEQPHMRRTQSRESMSQRLSRVREAAKQRKKERFTALFHLLTVEALEAAFLSLSRKAAAGVDGIRWMDYAGNMKNNITDLHRRLHQGSYRAQPGRRHYIPKADGKQRPLGIASLEDKIVQYALVKILNAVYENDFMGFSYAGTSEEGQWRATEEGTPQGAVISPLLANIYLHYVFDLWAHQWRRRYATGNVVMVRYADDIVIGFDKRYDARRFRIAMQRRLREFGLTVHPEKTRLMEFGRFAAENRAIRGKGKPETFNFLGFTHISGKDRNGRFMLIRKTRRDRMTATLKAIKDGLRRRWHYSIPEQGKWLRRVVQGYLNYHSVPGNFPTMQKFRTHVTNLWRRALRRRSQKDDTTWTKANKLAAAWLP